jgi:SAM-dependent methyltransferase
LVSPAQAQPYSQIGFERPIIGAGAGSWPPLARSLRVIATMGISLDGLVAGLPELYQPVFGHPELSNGASRRSQDRLAPILEIYRALEAQLQRPLRVLDLGCAQGFFSLNLARLGASVHGVDFQYGNIAVCQALARESAELEATFEAARIEDALKALGADQYDLVLGLSVFHHIIHRIGAFAVQEMLAALSDKVAAGVFELALASEPTAWAASQPGNPRQILAGFGFVLELAQNATHLSDVARPLYFASSRYWRLDGRMAPFDRWAYESHLHENGTHYGTRRYFFGRGGFAKLLQLDFVKCRAANLRDHCNEVAFLRDPPAGFDAPALWLHGHNDREAWLVREQWPGVLLIDLIRSRAPYDARTVLRDVVTQLAALEAAGLYHNDVRTWNVLIQPDGRAKLIDFGAISRDDKDCAWPTNLFLSFLIFAHETISGEVESLSPLRSPRLNPDGLPEPYRGVLWRLFDLPVSEWRFGRIRDSLAQADSLPDDRPASRPVGLTTALKAMEEACNIYRGATYEWRNRASQAEARARELQSPRLPAEVMKSVAASAPHSGV